jgi:hypothetical protein
MVIPPLFCCCSLAKLDSPVAFVESEGRFVKSITVGSLSALASGEGRADETHLAGRSVCRGANHILGDKIALFIIVISDNTHETFFP